MRIVPIFHSKKCGGISFKQKKSSAFQSIKIKYRNRKVSVFLLFLLCGCGAVALGVGCCHASAACFLGVAKRVLFPATVVVVCFVYGF